MSEPEYITIRLPVKATTETKDGITVDCLFTAIDHGKAYHNHRGNYARDFNNLEDYIWKQVTEQL